MISTWLRTKVHQHGERPRIVIAGGVVKMIGPPQSWTSRPISRCSQSGEVIELPVASIVCEESGRSSPPLSGKTLSPAARAVAIRASVEGPLQPDNSAQD